MPTCERQPGCLSGDNRKCPRGGSRKSPCAGLGAVARPLSWPTQILSAPGHLGRFKQEPLPHPDHSSMPPQAPNRCFPCPLTSPAVEAV